MGTRLAVAGSMLAGLAAVGGTAAAVAFQPPPTHEVQLVQPVRGGASVLSPKQFTPTTPTQAPVVAASSAPKVAMPKTAKPAPVVVPAPAGTVPTRAVNGARPRVGTPAPAGGVGGDPYATSKPKR